MHSAEKSLTSWMASFSVKFWSSTWTFISINHDWKNKYAMAEYPPFNLLLLDLQFVEFLHHHLHFIAGWISDRIKAGSRLLLLRKFSWVKCISPLRVCIKNAHGSADYALPMWLLLPAHLQNESYQWLECLVITQRCAPNLYLIWHLLY